MLVENLLNPGSLAALGWTDPVARQPPRAPVRQRLAQRAVEATWAPRARPDAPRQLPPFDRALLIEHALDLLDLAIDRQLVDRLGHGHARRGVHVSRPEPAAPSGCRSAD